MSEIESLINSLRGMELPKGAESLLSTILSKANSLESSSETLKKALDKREGENKTARDTIKALEEERDGLKAKQPKDGSVILSSQDAAEFEALRALGSSKDLKTSLEQAQADRQALTTAGNKEALQTLGLKPSALRLREFDGVVITAAKDKDGKVSGTVKVGDTESSYEQFVKDKGLEGDLRDFALQPAGVPVVAQHAGGGGTVGPKTSEERAGDLRGKISI